MEKSIDKTILVDACAKAQSISHVLRILKIPENGNNRNKLKKLCENYKIRLPRYKQKRKYELIEKICPVCEKTFTTLLNSPHEKTVCSYSCSNTYFRSGPNNPGYKDLETTNSYRRICFEYHQKECCICKFDYIVEVHHRDGDKENNHPTNLIPLCSNHHRMYHSRHRPLVSPLIEDYYLKIKNILDTAN